MALRAPSCRIQALILSSITLQPHVLLTDSFSGRLRGAQPGENAYYPLQSQGSTVLFVGPGVPIYPKLQFMFDMRTLVCWVSQDLASIFLFPALWLVNPPTLTKSSYSNEGGSRSFFSAGFLSPKIMCPLLRGTTMTRRLTASSVATVQL